MGDVNPVDLRDLVANHDVRPERPEQREAPQLTDGVWELAENCWLKEPGSRPVAGAVCNAIVRLLDAPVQPAGIEERPQGAAAPATGLGLRLDHEDTARTIRADASELALQLKNPSAYLSCCLPSLQCICNLRPLPPFQFCSLLTIFVQDELAASAQDLESGPPRVRRVRCCCHLIDGHLD